MGGGQSTRGTGSHQHCGADINSFQATVTLISFFYFVSVCRERERERERADSGHPSIMTPPVSLVIGGVSQRSGELIIPWPVVME